MTEDCNWILMLIGPTGFFLVPKEKHPFFIKIVTSVYCHLLSCCKYPMKTIWIAMFFFTLFMVDAISFAFINLTENSLLKNILTQQKCNLDSISHHQLKLPQCKKRPAISLSTLSNAAHN